MLAAIRGLAGALNASALAFQTVRSVGVAYFFFRAGSAGRGGGGLAITNGTPSRSAGRVILTAVVINLLNPKLTLFFCAFLPQFVSTSDASPVPKMLELSAVFMAMTLVVFAGYGFVASAARERILSRPRVMTWMRRLFAGAFVALAARLALAER